MNCDKIRDKLSDYLEGTLNGEDTSLVRSHIRACRKCGEAFADLQKTVEHVKGLEEVEPPQWLTQKVMARVKEEADQKSIWRKLFYPLHIKLPIEAVATLLVAVTAFYVFQETKHEIKVEELKSIESLEQSAGTEVKTRDKKTSSPRNKGKKPGSAPTQKDFLPPGPVPAETPKAEAPPQPAYEMRPLQKEPETMNKFAYPAESESSSRRKHTAAGYGGGSPKAEEKLKPADTLRLQQTVQHEKKARAIPGESLTERAIIPLKSIEITLTVRDLDISDKMLGTLISELGGRNVRTDNFTGRKILTLAIDSGKVNDFLNKVKEIGELKDKKPSLPATEGPVTIKVEIVKIQPDK